jgi:hypothetical protein
MNKKHDSAVNSGSLKTPPPLSVVRGTQVDAVYTEQEIPEYQDNPLIEAQPPLWTKGEVAQLLSYYPYYNARQRTLSDEIRLHLIENCREFYIPWGIHYEIHLSISNMIRRSYIYRNPADQKQWNEQPEKIKQFKRGLDSGSYLRSKARGLAIVGVGGIGKSTAVENILSHYPQVITHTWYKESDLILRQLVWVKLQCPGDGSLKSLCLNYIKEVDDILGTDYMKLYGGTRRTLDELLITMGRIASNHYQGLLVLDEIQDLSEAKGGGASHMLNFFVQMENTLGIPFILIGTPKIRKLFDGEFRQARRISEQGDIVWRPMREVAIKEKPDEPDRADPDWNAFVRAMWKYWYLKKDHPLPGDKLREQSPGASSVTDLSEGEKEGCLLSDKAVSTLYEVSQGITAVVVTIFFLAQRRAITSGVENITSGVIKNAVKDNQHYIDEMLDKLREGRFTPPGAKKISRISDLEVEEARPLAALAPDPDGGGKKETSAKSGSKSPDNKRPGTEQNGGDPQGSKAGSRGTKGRGGRKSTKADETYEPGDLRGLKAEISNEAGGAETAAPTDAFLSATDFLD